MNKVILAGRLTRDPESRMTQSNMEISRFSLACQSDFVSRDGERDTEFINCVAFNRSAQTINRYCRKGQMILVQGRIRNSSYDAQDGTKRYTTDVVVDNFEFLGSRNDGGNTNNYSNPSSNNSVAYSPEAPQMPGSVETTDISEDPYKDFGDEFTLSSDDLPF
jgi:single-strand DNA-binding protein